MRTGNGFGGGPRAVAAQLARAVEIATILSASGFDWLVQALGLSGWVSPAAWSAVPVGHEVPAPSGGGRSAARAAAADA